MNIGLWPLPATRRDPFSLSPDVVWTQQPREEVARRVARDEVEAERFDRIVVARGTHIDLVDLRTGLALLPFGGAPPRAWWAS